MYSLYRKLGVVADSNPIALSKLGDKIFIYASLYDFIQVYRYENLSVCLTTKKLPKIDSDPVISSILTIGHDIYAASGSKIYVFDKVAVSRIYLLSSNVTSMLLVGKVLLVAEESRQLTLINVATKTVVHRISLVNTSICKAIFHPDTYINKVLLLYSNCDMELWNFNTKTLIYTFQSHRKAFASNTRITTISAIAQTPYCDIVALGFNFGDILFINMKTDQIVMSCKQNQGLVTGIAFQSRIPAFGSHLCMATSSSNGVINIWLVNPKDSSTSTCHVDLKAGFAAHDGSVTTIKFMDGEPVLLTSSIDNSIKLWIFDSSKFDPRLLKGVSGHRGYPSRMRFFNTKADFTGAFNSDHSSCEVFSCCPSSSSLRYSSIVMEQKSRDFSTKKIKSSDCKVSPILDFDFANTSDGRWGDIVTIHRNSVKAYVWTSTNRAITDKVLVPPGYSKLNPCRVSADSYVYARAVTVSACGHFCLLGYRNGSIFKFNIQSGLERGRFPIQTAEESASAHERDVTGVFSDVANTVVVSCSLDGSVAFWNFSNHSLLKMLQFTSPWIMLRGCRDTGFVAVANQQHNIFIFDIHQQSVVRKFEGGHSRKITDIVFTPDNRQIITSSLDTTIRVWDFPTGRCISWISFENSVTALAVSPSGEYLCVALYDTIGFSVYIDCSMYGTIYINNEPSSPTPVSSISNSISANNTKVSAFHSNLQSISSQAKSESLITLSSLPRLYCTNLFFLEMIRKRNELQQKTQKSEIPFFLADIGKKRVISEVPVSPGLD